MFIVHPQFKQGVGHADVLAQFEDEGQKAVEPRGRQTQISGQAGDALFNGRAIEFQHVGHQGGVGHAVMGVVQRTNRMGEGMHAAQAFLEGGGPHRCGREHLPARVEVRRGVHGPHQCVGHQAHAFDRDAIGHGVESRRTVRLQTVRQGIHAGTGGDFGRHADGHGRVADDYAGHHFRMEDDPFGVACFVDDHRRTAHFRTCTRRGRHRDDRGDAAFIGAGPVVADVFEIPDRAGLAAHERNELAHVQAAATAEGDHTVVFAGAPGVEPAGQVGFDRVGLEVAEQRDAQAVGAQGIEGRRGDRGSRQATVGHQ